MTTSKQAKLAEALLRLSHENTQLHEMKSAWDKFWSLCSDVDVAHLSKKAQVAYAHGVVRWGTPKGRQSARANNQERAEEPDNGFEYNYRKSYQEERRQSDYRQARADWEYQQAYRSDPNPRGFTMRSDEQESDRTYHTEYKHPRYGTKAERVMPDQHVRLWCHECGQEVDVTHYPGNTGKYCSPACKHRATNRQAAARMRAKRIRDKATSN